MKNSHYILIIFILINFNSFCQQWSVQLGGDWGDGSYTTVTSSTGNTFVSGGFGGSSLITPVDTLYETTHGDLFSFCFNHGI